MSEAETCATPIVVEAQPTEADYREALAANALWTQMTAKARSPWIWRVRRFTGSFIASLLGLVVATEPFSMRGWIINPLEVLLALLLYPILVIQVLVTSQLRGREMPEGIIEIPQNLRGGPGARTARSVSGWLVIYVVFIPTCLILFKLGLRNRVGAFFLFPPSSTAAPPQKVPKLFLLGGSILLMMVLSPILAHLQRRKATKQLLTLVPTLLRPRTWEFCENGLSERGELLESTMKWEYLRKFFETPSQILLYSTDQSFYLVPRSAFASSLQYDLFMALLTRKVLHGVRQPHSRGFQIEINKPMAG